MATVVLMRDKLSEEIGDYFKSTTTSDGSDGEDLVDAELKKYDDDDFIDKFDTQFLIEGDVTATGETNFATAKTTNTVAFRGSYSALIPNNTLYSVHKLFTAEHKDRAIESARKDLFPIIFLEAQKEVTIVKDQFTYDISSAGFEDPLGAFRDIVLVDSGDSENFTPLTRWELVPGQTNKLKFNVLPGVGEIVRLIGIKTAALSDYDVADENILVAYAAWKIFGQGVQAAPGDVAARSTNAKNEWERKFDKAVRRFKKVPPAIREPR